MTQWTLCIPSARRAETLAAKTAPMVEAGGVPLDRVRVFVPDEADLLAYQAALPTRWWSTLEVLAHEPEHAGTEDVGVRPHGLGAARNAIVSSFAPGDRIVQVDDDLRGVLRRVSEKRAEPVALAEAIEECWSVLPAEGALWGIYPVRNPYFMKDRVRHDLTYICGGLFGQVVSGEEWERVRLDDKEDFERSLRTYEALGTVTRVEYLAIDTQGYAGDGGMQASRTRERVDVAARWLAEQYPDLCSLNLKKKSGWAEVRLRDRRR